MSPLARATALGLWAMASSAAAQVSDEAVGRRGQGWSVLGGRTVGEGSSVAVGQFGWPGVSARLLRGASPRVDVGGAFAFNYGREGFVTQVVPGLKLQGVLRVMLWASDRASFGLQLAPGPFLYFEPGRTTAGVALPVQLAFSIEVGSALALNLGLDLPVHATFGFLGAVTLPVLSGAGVEYFLDRDLSVSFNTRMGPAFTFGQRQARFALEALLGVAYRFSLEGGAR